MRGRAAYSLVEVMIVAGLLAAVLVPVYDLFVSGMRGTARVIDHALALQSAQEPLDLLQNLPWLILRRHGLSLAASLPLAGDERFRRQVRIREIEINRLIRIDVRVLWLDRNGREQELGLTALAANQEFDR